MSGERVDVEISVINTGNRELLRGCLATVEAACAGVSWRLTVVENASGDGSAEMVAAEFPWARVLQNERRLGFSANHNQVIRPALEHDTCRYVLILNEDTDLAPGAVAELVAFADREPRAGAVGPLVRLPDGGARRSLLPFTTVRDQLRSALLPAPGAGADPESGWLNGSCVLFRAGALREVGPLDERFFIFFEDADICLRLHGAGWTSHVCASASVVHQEHATVGSESRSQAMERQMLRSRFLYFEKHRGRVVATALAWLVRLTLLVRAARALARAVLHRDDARRAQAGALLALARYDPQTVLPHERLARAER